MLVGDFNNNPCSSHFSACKSYKNNSAHLMFTELGGVPEATEQQNERLRKVQWQGHSHGGDRTNEEIVRRRNGVFSFSIQYSFRYNLPSLDVMVGRSTDGRG